MVDPKHIYKYYASDEFTKALIMPDQHQFRHFRGRQANNRWRKIPVKIRDKFELQKWIIKLGLVDVYYSTSQWLQPHKVAAMGLSGSYHITDNLLLDHDLMFDIDASADNMTYAGIDRSRKSTYNILKGIQEMGCTLKYCSFTGAKGFRLVVTDPNFHLPSNPRYRLDYVVDNRKLFISELHRILTQKGSELGIYKQDTFFDNRVTHNPMCVIRVLGTVNSKTGFVSVPMPPDDLVRSAKYIINHVPYVGKERPGIPLKFPRKMTQEDEVPRLRLHPSATDVSGLASLPPNPKYKYFFSNKVLGIKRGFIPIFIYQRHQNYWRSQMLKLQAEYKLGTLYVYNIDDKIIVVSIKIMQRRRLQKILNKSTSPVKYDFRKHRRILCPFVMMHIENLPAKYTGYLSRGHLSYVDPRTRVTKGDYAGWSQIEIVRAKYEEGDTHDYCIKI